MTVSAGNHVSIEYTLTLEDEQVVDTNVGKDPLTFVQGENQIITGLEKKLEGMDIGESKQVEISPEGAYGQIDPEAIVKVEAEKLPEKVKSVGAMVQAKTPKGEVLHGRVLEIEGEMVTVDFNHPLAGKALFFDVKILSIEEK